MWLEPLPDRSLPSLNIQKAMFPLLDRMYIDSTSLKMSGLGKLVLFYTRCDRVDKSIARIADRLIGEHFDIERNDWDQSWQSVLMLSIESWSRPILKRSSSYRDRQQARKEYQADPTRTLQRSKGSQLANQSSSQRARIPESVTGNAFKYAPVTSISEHPDETRSSSQKINKFKRSMQAAKQRWREINVIIPMMLGSYESKSESILLYSRAEGLWSLKETLRETDEHLIVARYVTRYEQEDLNDAKRQLTIRTWSPLPGVKPVLLAYH